MPDTTYTVEFANEARLFRFVKGLSRTQALLLQAVFTYIETFGLVNLLNTEWSKHLGGGVFELRLGKTTRHVANRFLEPDSPIVPNEKMLLRVFMANPNVFLFLVLSSYNKLADTSHRRQQLEIQVARSILRSWRPSN